MKWLDPARLFNIIVIVLFYVTCIFSQDSKCELANSALQESKSKLLDRFSAKDYDQAYKIANDMVRVGEVNCEANDDLLLTLYMNVAQIQLNRKKYDESQKIYDQNLDRAEKVYGANSEDFQKYTEDLLRLSVRTVGTEKFENYALKLLEAKKKRFGDYSVESMNELTRMGRFYSSWKKPDLAEKYFLQAMDVADKLPPEMDEAKRKAINRYRVFLIKRYGEKEGLIKDEALMLQRYPDLLNRETVLNGLAYSLPRPALSFEARNMKASGEVLISIKVSQEGRVVSAKATSGHPLLVSEAESAARAAKFLPTYLKGKRVVVTGIITYRFIY